MVKRQMFVILRLTFIALIQHQQIDEGHGGVKFPGFVLTTDASELQTGPVMVVPIVST